VVFVAILAAGFGAFALLAHTRHALVTWIGSSLCLVAMLFLTLSKRV